MAPLDPILETGKDAITVLRHLRIHEALTIKDHGNMQPWPVTPDGLSVRAMDALLSACAHKGLVTDEAEIKPTGGIANYKQHKQHTYRRVSA